MVGVFLKSRKKDKPDPGRGGGLAILNWLRDCLYESPADCLRGTFGKEWDV